MTGGSIRGGSQAELDYCVCVPIFTVMAWPALNSDDNHSGRDWSVNSTELCSHDWLDGWLDGWLDSWAL